MNITDLVIATQKLPDTIEELLPLRFMGESAVKLYQEKISLIDKLELGTLQRQETLLDGQDAGRALLAIESKIGKLLPKGNFGGGDRHSKDFKQFSRDLEDTGMNPDQRSKARQIAEHPEEVKEVIKEAEENEDIPTKTAVLTKIKMKKYMEKHPEPEKKLPNVNEIANSVNSKLIECLAKLRSIWIYEDQINQITKDTIYETIDDLYQLILGGQ